MNELDERLASLHTERARPMARWGTEPRPPTAELMERRLVASEVGAITRYEMARLKRERRGAREAS